MMGEEERDRLEAIEERLYRIERRLSRTQTGGGGIGCLGFILFMWVILTLQQILERLPPP